VHADYTPLGKLAVMGDRKHAEDPADA
jgi:hypothetical protein